MKEDKINREDIVIVVVLSILLLAMLITGISKSEVQAREWSVAESVIVKSQETYKLHFTDGETSEVSCYVADLFDNDTQLFCADEDYEFTNIYGNIVKVEIVEK